MPIYEYQCKSCQRDFEIFVRGQHTELVCPQCGGHDLHKRISRFNSAGDTGPEFSGGCGRCDMPGGCRAN